MVGFVERKEGFEDCAYDLFELGANPGFGVLAARSWARGSGRGGGRCVVLFAKDDIGRRNEMIRENAACKAWLFEGLFIGSHLLA